jgi:hypothetical protein
MGIDSESDGGTRVVGDQGSHDEKLSEPSECLLVGPDELCGSGTIGGSAIARPPYILSSRVCGIIPC